MASWVDRCESVWLDSSLIAALITGVAALAMIQGRQPVRRRAWARSGLLASLAIIPLVALNPLPKINLKHPAWILRDPRSSSATADFGSPTSEAVPPGSASDPARPWLGAVRRGLVIGYAIGVMLALGRVGLGWAGAAHLVRRAGRASGRAEALLASLPFDRGGHRPRILLSDRVGRPVLVGACRPVIVVPRALDRPELVPQLRLGLLHELAHAEMLDHRFAAVAELAWSCWFFLPQVWWVRNQLRLDAEFLADRRAVGHFGTSYRYAESLVGLAFDPASSSSPPICPAPPSLPSAPEARQPAWPGPGGGLASALLQRVQMLLKCPFEVENRPPRRWTVAVVTLVAGITLAGSCLSIREDHRRDTRLADAPVALTRAFQLAELAIAPAAAEAGPFDLRFPLPDRFRLTCEILATAAELEEVEILGYPLGPGRPPGPGPGRPELAWRRVEVRRDAGGLESVGVGGAEIIAPHRPARPADWLTIRPLLVRTTRIRGLHLSW